MMTASRLVTAGQAAVIRYRSGHRGDLAAIAHRETNHARRNQSPTPPAVGIGWHTRIGRRRQNRTKSPMV
jgi:hypothetical protein